MGWRGKGEIRRPGWPSPSLGAAEMGLEAGFQGSCSSAHRFQGSSSLCRGQPCQTGPWKSGIRELGSYFPVTRPDDRKGNSQRMIRCLTLPRFSAAFATASGSPNRTGSMDQPWRRAAPHTESQPQARAELRPLLRARGCRGRGRSGQEFARVVGGQQKQGVPCAHIPLLVRYLSGRRVPSSLPRLPRHTRMARRRR